MMERGEEILESWPFPLTSSQSDCPREQILLFATLYGSSDIQNGRGAERSEPGVLE